MTVETKIGPIRPDVIAGNGILHRIDIVPHPNRHEPPQIFYQGQLIGRHDGAIHAAARWLLEQGIAKPEDGIATYRGEMPCLAGIVGELAEWTVQDPPKGQLHYARYKPFSLAKDQL